GRRVALVVGLLLLAVVGGYVWQRPLPPNPLVPVLRTATRPDSAASSVLGVLAPQTAWSSAGFGCTLDDQRPDLPKATIVNAAGNPFTDAAAPEPAPA